MNTAAETCIPGSVSAQKYNDEQTGRSSQAAIRLLIVEDDPDISSLLVYTLERAHFNATAVGDCKAAWEAMADNAFDLILLDWMLPDMSGIELLRRMRKALEPFGKDDLIQTVRGAGYRFSDHG